MLAAAQRAGSSSNRSEEPGQHDTPPPGGYRGHNLSVPSGANELPGYIPNDSLLRPQAGGPSAYPAASSGPYPTSARPRAHTFADAMQNGQQEQYRRGTPVTPGQQASPWQQPGARHVSAGGTYVPPPPPPPSAPPNPGMQLPGPPPRMPSHATQPHAQWIPPPPGAPNSYAMYNRQASHPPFQHQQPYREPRQYDPTAYADYMQLPPLPPDNQPLTSATYIPGSDSFGPGVGIPPLESHRTVSVQSRPGFTQQHSYDYNNTNQYGQDYPATWYGNNQYHEPPPNHQLPTQAQPQPLQQNNFPPPTPTVRQNTIILPPAKEREEYRSSPAQEHPRVPFHQPSSSTNNETSSNRDHSSSGETPASPQDQNWPLDRVQIWLAAHAFSKEWQDALRHLNVHGAQFLDIGKVGGQRNVGFMMQTVLPQVARECTASGGIWDQAKEREEAKRLRRLVRDVISTGGASTPASSTIGNLPLRANRRESSQFGVSAGADGTLENSPDLARSNNALAGSTPSTAGGTGDDSPGLHMPTIAQRRYSNTHPRAHTYDSSMNDSIRSAMTKELLGSVNDIPKRHSPNASGEVGGGQGIRGFSSSPQSSPGLNNAKPVPNGGGPRYYSHNRGVSSETNIALQAKSMSLVPGRASEPQRPDGDSAFAKPPPEDSNRRRNATDSSRPPYAEHRGSAEAPASALGKEHKRGFLDKFKRTKKDEAHPSPEDEQSPASPQMARQFPHKFPTHQSSSSSLVDRPPSRNRKHESVETTNSYFTPPASMRSSRQPASEKDRKFIFVTPDGWNYRLIDITEIESAEMLRTVICYNLGVQESSEVTVHLTSPGQTEHEEALSDQLLMNARKNVADATGSLRLYVRTASATNAVPDSAGLGLQIPQSPFGRPSISDRPLDPLTYAKLNEGVDSALAMPDKPDIANLPDDERQALLEAKAEEHRREMDRRQKAYLESRRSKIETGSGKKIHDFDAPRDSRPGSSGSADLDRKSDTLVPMRKPPPVPEPTSTLRKADSLTKKGGPVNMVRTSWPNRKEEWKRNSGGSIPEEDGGKRTNGGIGSALAGMGMAARAIGTPSSAPGAPSAPGVPSGLQKSETAPILPVEARRPEVRPSALSEINFNSKAALGGRASPGSPKSPFTHSKGGQMFKIPDYVENDEGAEDDEDTLKANQPNLKLSIPANPTVNKIKKASSPDLSPSSAPAPGRLNRHSTKRGPSFQLPERQVDFQHSPAVLHEESEDSDDGLFAVPLKRQQQKLNSAKTPSSARAQAVLGITSGPTNRSPNRPELKVKTSKSNVKFESPLDKKPSEEGESIERHVPMSASSNQYSTDSPEDFGPGFGGRRESFASDMWANRPPAEGIVEHLDEFFPNVDLDQPVVEENGETAESSPAAPDKPTLSVKTSSQDLSGNSRSVTPASSADESDTLGSDQSTLKRGDLQMSVAQRNMRRAGGGLGRTKSIRDVVKTNYNMQPGPLHHLSTSSTASSRVGSGVPTINPPVNRVSMLRSDGAAGIVRRKSTKMFGARIEQVKPARGSRLINNLETIPQDTIPPENITHVNQRGPERQPTFKWMRGQLIGKGTFGRVYLGMNTTTGELLAVKQVEVSHNSTDKNKDDPAKIKEMVKALDIEIDTMKDLDHVNIVQYLGCEKKEFSISIFLEYISGGSVGSCLRKHGRFEVSVVSSLTRQTLNGLAYLHGEGILHRDLKADNILLDLDGTCKISDFGISKRSANPYNNDITNSMQGSVFWMAPEVIRAQSQPGGALTSGDGLGASNASLGYSAKVDIWSLGCVVLEMFAGRRPWSKEEAIGAIYKLGSLNQAPPIPDDVSSVVGPAALSFMYDCFTIPPGERPTAETLLRAPFCIADPHYNFLDTELYAKIRGAF